MPLQVSTGHKVYYLAVRLSLRCYQSCEGDIFENKWNQVWFCCKFAQVVRMAGDEAVNFGGQEVKDQGHVVQS